MSQEQKYDLSIMSLGGYTKPAIKENAYKKWVEYGDDNNYFQYLIDCYNGSPTHNAIVNGVAQLIYGNGLDATDSDSKPAFWIDLQRTIKNEELRKVAIDLKLFGMYALQVLYNQGKKRIVEAYHHPLQTLRAEIADIEGNVRAYYYSWDWTKSTDKRYRPRRIPAFGFGEENEFVELIVVKPYSAGKFYYAPVDYQGGVQYAELEEEIANFNINYIQNGLFAGALINFNNGVPPQEEREQIESKIKSKFSGSTNSGRFILAFNADPTKKADITAVETKDYTDMLRYLSEEAMKKLMVAHRLVSPMLLGIKDNTGLGNNADELKTASTLFDNTVIRPYQQLILEGLGMITRFNGYILDLYFKTLQPLEFTDTTNATTKEEKEKETGVKMHSHRAPDFPEEIELAWMDYLKDKGEIVDNSQWDLVSETPVEDPEAELEMMTFSGNYVNPQDKSPDGDSGLVKVRYKYAPSRLVYNSRKFCVAMVQAANEGKVYRREDIVQMGEDGVNSEFAAKGESTYSIWLYKGGANCHHYWTRVVYFRKRNARGQFEPKSATPDMEHDKQVTVESIRKEVDPKVLNPKGWDKAKARPIDMPSKGYKYPR